MKYKIIMSKNDFFKIHNRIATSNLEINKDDVTFEVELGSLNILKESGYSYHLVDSFRIKLKEFMNKYYLLVFGILLVFSILYINSYRVNKIIFNTKTPINSKIEAAIEENYKKIFTFNFSNLNYTEFSKSLRAKYVEYPYINVYNKNNDILVDIYTYNDNYPIENKGSSTGDIIATKDGVVDNIYVYNGCSLVSKNKYVKKGDILISGTINNNFVVSKGLVLGYTFEKAVISIPKEEKVEVLTGNTQSYFDISIANFKFSINKENEYSLYEYEYKTKFNIFDFFSIKEIEEYEKNDIIKENTQDLAIEIGKEKLITDFEACRISDQEYIVDVKPYHIIENKDDYEITYILKKYESLGVFQAY